MFLPTIFIERNSFINDIVKQNYRTADVFRKHGIDFCCGGRWPLESACMAKGIEFDELKKELLEVSHIVQLPSSLPFNTWPVEFLTSYIINIHHHYLKTILPETEIILKNFIENHAGKYPSLQQVYKMVVQLRKDILPRILKEEESIFPYICQITNAYSNNDSYAKLLVKTLRKPIEIMTNDEHNLLSDYIYKFRELTDNYTAPDHACTIHKISMARLKELDDDLVQHTYLESEILFPRAIRIEKELLK